MTHTKPMADSDGTFADWKAAPETQCPKCGVTGHVAYRIWESHDGAYEDVNYYCRECNHRWWVDGIDS